MRHFLAFAALGSLCAHPLLAADAAPEYRRSSLLERTPFAKSEKPSAKASAKASAAAGPLELRGFYGSGDTLEVSITRPDTKEAAWVKVGDKTAKWVVESADPVAGTATVRYDGLSINLRLVMPEATPAALASPKAPEPAQSNGRDPRASLSPEAREIMRSVMRENMNVARREHPEYFDGTKLSDEQRTAREEYMRAGFEKVREAVAKVSPEEAAKLEGARARSFGNIRPGGDGIGLQIGNSAPPPAPAPNKP